MAEIILNDLPPDDPYRNTPLIDLGVHYRRPDSKVWQEMTPAYTLARKKITFNQLGEVWQRDLWKVTRPIVDWEKDDKYLLIGNDL